MKYRGIFAEDFSDIFSEILDGGLVADKLPETANAPDPDIPDIEAPSSPEAPVIPVDAFDFDLPGTASAQATKSAPASAAPAVANGGAVSVDFGPLFAPGGNGGGKPGGNDGGGGGGGGGGPKGGGGNTPVAEYTSGSQDGSGLNIDLQFFGDWGSATATALIGYMQNSAEFLSDIIVAGLPDDDVMFNSFDEATRFLVDDILIEVYLGNLKGGVVAQTEIYGANDFNGNGTPETFTGAKITFNKRSIDNIDGLGGLDDTALHEMFHALGFGYWGVAENALTEAQGNQIVYSGASATGRIVENDGLSGSIGAHWSEAAYGNELMTSEVELADVMFLDYASVASLRDLAVVNEAGSTGYVLASNWETQVDNLNGTSADGGIDLDAWALTFA